MSYEEIMKISDIIEKENALKDFYINTIKVNDWLTNTQKVQKIRFKDRIEYKVNGQYHRLNGPAIEPLNGNKGFFYLYGEIMNEEDWKIQAKQISRAKKLKTVLED
jgi:hypothetical protein